MNKSTLELPKTSKNSRKTNSQVQFDPLMSKTATNKFKPTFSNYGGSNQVRLSTEGNRPDAVSKQELRAQKVYQGFTRDENLNLLSTKVKNTNYNDSATRNEDLRNNLVLNGNKDNEYGENESEDDAAVIYQMNVQQWQKSPPNFKHAHDNAVEEYDDCTVHTSINNISQTVNKKFGQDTP